MTFKQKIHTIVAISVAATLLVLAAAVLLTSCSDFSVVEKYENNTICDDVGSYKQCYKVIKLKPVEN